MERKWPVVFLVPLLAAFASAFSEDAVRIEAYGAGTPGRDGFASYYESAKALDGMNCHNYRYASVLQCEYYKGLISTYANKYFPSTCSDRITLEKFKLVLYYQLEKESKFDANAVNRKNPARGIIDSSYGIAQFTEGTANSFGIGIAGAYVPEKAMEAQAKYMRKLMQDGSIVKCDYRLALAGYNSGLGTVQRAGGIPQNRYTPDYVLAISNDVEGAVSA